MNNERMESVQGKDGRTPHGIAIRNELPIKWAIGEKFGVLPEKLTLLSSDQEGVYFSKEKPNVLCSLVVDEEQGFIYLVSGEFNPDTQELKNFKCDILS